MSSPGKKEATILVVEDEADILTLVSRTLDLEGYRVLQAMDGEAGLKVLTETRVDLLLLDLRLPVLDGWAVLSEIKNTPGLKAIPVVIISASVGPAKEEEALKIGAAAFLTKPVNLDELINTVRQILRGRR